MYQHDKWIPKSEIQKKTKKKLDIVGLPDHPLFLQFKIKCWLKNSVKAETPKEFTRALNQKIVRILERRQFHASRLKSPSAIRLLYTHSTCTNGDKF